METEALGALRRHPLFAPLPSHEIHALLDGHEVLEFPEGAVLFREADTASHLFLILSGEVVLLPSPNGESTAMLLRLTSGETVGEEAVLSGIPYCSSAQTTAPTTVIALPAHGLMGYLESHFEVAITMISSMAAHLREQVKEITELKMQSTSERLASFLLSLAGDASGHAVVRLPYEKRHLAEHLGMDPATLSRAFAKLRDKGVVASRTDKVEIADVARLRSYGDGAAITH
ncbi:Crp/Fnr family transcriptional regulator [Magnetospirillum sp. SS-4]|uniref:Crp/Fnr family transcriptional regulator n=1 Tax=Magnetospirillum sp. SS-4 TaxID=2681465 RepID=UPI00137D0D8B|nr:helix-turn-helix domain-containing protein [Magnetospirillum sp. SS-4]CAA7626039.1 cAMP-binding protein [Magnetospirillum sp. SS-4]